MADETSTWNVPKGDAGRHLPMDELEQRLGALPAAPKDSGRVARLFARPGSNQRQPLARARLTASAGMPGDRWAAGSKELIANGQPVGLFGDNLFLELDLSEANLPVGTRVKLGGATLEVTPEPHNGCLKFKGRFGSDALRLVSRPENRHQNLRGIYLKVVEDGEVAEGDPVEVLRG
jgi:hypothetical protein